MNEQPTHTFIYEHCDVPEGQSLAQWRTARQPSQRRRAHGAGGVFSVLSAHAPQLLRSRGGRSR
jgi:hypothetical protein